MFQETFEIEVKKGKNISKKQIEEEEGSEIEDDDELEEFQSEDENEEIHEYLQKAFSDVGEVSATGNREFMIHFYKPNSVLVEDEEDYDFDIYDGIPMLTETEQFIPFVNFMKNHEFSLTGITLYTNLEGGGHLII
tara:strand:+ start:52 stop:459 length:408 start_codon:yes stop_codon:yes gene_type:complete